MSETLILARKDAVAKGDKALARELYRQLVEKGYRPEDIDATTATDEIPTPVGASPKPAPEPVPQPPSSDPAVVRLFEQRRALEAELGDVQHAKTGNKRRVGEVQEQIERVTSEMDRLVAREQTTEASDERGAADEAAETTEAPEPPEKVVKPAPKKRVSK